MGKRIVTVDDSTSVRQLVTFTLKRAGYDVVEAIDGKDALSKLNGNPFHLIITDLNMPNLDGIGLIKSVRSNPACKFIPIVMLTTESQDTKNRKAKRPVRQAGSSSLSIRSSSSP